MENDKFRIGIERWIEQHFDFFSLQKSGPEMRQISRLKPLSELMLYAEVTAQQSPQFAKTIAQFAWDEIDQGDYIFRLLCARPDYCQAASILASLSSFGFLNQRAIDAVAAISRMSFVVSLPVEPWVGLSVSHAFQRLRIGKLRLEDSPRLWTSFRSEPWLIAEGNAYALTHEIFYMTDFGRQPFGISAELGEYVKWFMPSWLEIYMRKKNFDILSELLMVNIYTSTKAPSEKYWSALFDSQFEDGSVSPPSHAGRGLISDGDSTETRDFFSKYHTTLVAGMAATAAIINC